MEKAGYEFYEPLSREGLRRRAAQWAMAQYADNCYPTRPQTMKDDLRRAWLEGAEYVMNHLASEIAGGDVIG